MTEGPAQIAGETSRFPQTPSTGPLRGRELQSAAEGDGFTLWFTGLSGSGNTTIDRIGWVASKLTRHGAAVIVSAISPYTEARRNARKMVEEHGTFIEVFVDASVEECARRDVKGLYEKAMRGDIPNFTGVSDPYEAPANPEIRIESEHESPEESALRILAFLEDRQLIPSNSLLQGVGGTR